jgi:hypothetical protein
MKPLAEGGNSHHATTKAVAFREAIAGTENEA